MTTSTSYIRFSCRAVLAERLATVGCPGATTDLAAFGSTPPLVLLDTVALPLEDLLTILLVLRTTATPTFALIDPADVRTRRLLVLCPAVRVIVSDQADFRLLATLLWQLDCGAIHQRQWIGLEPPTEPRLPLRTLDLLHAMPQAQRHRQTAAACGLSRATAFRLIDDMRQMLGLEPGDNTAPIDLYQQIITHLAAPAPLQPLPRRHQEPLPRYRITAAGQLAPLKMLDEAAQNEEYRRRHRARAAQKHAQRSEEQRAEQRRKDQERRAQMTETQRQEKNRKQREQAAQKNEQRRQERAEQRAQRQTTQQQEQARQAQERADQRAAQAAERRRTWQERYQQQRDEQGQKRQERSRAPHAQTAEEQRQKSNRQAREQYVRKQARQTEEQRQERNRKARAYQAQRFARMSEEQRQEQRQEHSRKNLERYYRQRAQRLAAEALAQPDPTKQTDET